MKQKEEKIKPMIITTICSIITGIIMFIFLELFNADSGDLLEMFLLAFFVVVICGVGFGYIVEKINEKENKEKY